MSFHSLYTHGFVRVAACTTRCSLADPQANVEAVLAVARSCGERGVAVAVFPELAISGYAIDDLLLQDVAARCRRVKCDRGGSWRARRDLHAPACSSGRRCATAARLYNCALVDRAPRPAAGRRTQDPICPTIASSTSIAALRQSGADRESDPRSRCRARSTAPFGPDLLFGAEDRGRASSSMPKFARTSGFRCRRAPSRGARRRHHPGQPFGEQHHHRQGRYPPLAVPQSQSGALHCGLSLCLGGRRGRIDDGSFLGRAGVDLRERRGADGKSERFPAAEQMAVADIDLDLLRQERMRGKAPSTTTDDAIGPAPYRPISGRIDVPARPANRTTSASNARVERFPFVPAKPERLAQDCYEGLQHPGLRARSNGSEPSACGTIGHRRVRGARFDPGAHRGRQGVRPVWACRAPTSWPSRCRALRRARRPRPTR